MKLYKMIFFNTMIMGTMIAISSYSWMSMWMGLEINLLSIIPLFSNKENVFSTESSLKYFITQAIASAVLLMSIILMLSTNEFIAPTMNFYLMMVLNSALLTKLGAAPFHYWFPEVMEGLNWMNCLILLTWQKIAPMMLIMNNQMNTKFTMMIILTCMIVSTVMAFNQISLRKILTFSSINHIGWMLSTTFISFPSWIIYFSVYSILNINIIAMFHMTKSFYLNQINNIMNKMKMLKFSLLINFLSLGGLPPFIGFLPKWMVINWLVINKMPFIALMMTLLTLVMLYIYTRITLSSLLLSITETKFVNLKFNNQIMLLINFISLFSLILCTLMFNLM
uniref:NADH-ubiquinone oxidoreductase chain 2 n=1 Tax=Pelecyphorus foveolatus TaxID=2841848 RepID=A0A8F3JCH7_9CUCU|nr:NADH dehydrogenase subunit 2 [Pelecyphorus foveolatus]